MKNGKWKKIAVVLAAAFLMTGCGNAASQGVKALKEGDYASALSRFQEAAKSSDASLAAEGYQGMGMTYYETGDYSAALDAFEEALDKGGKETAQLDNLAGVCAMQTGDYGAGLEYIQAGLALADPEDKELYQEMRYNEIVCLEQQGDWENAKEKVKDYLEDYPDDENAQKEAEFLQTR